MNKNIKVAIDDGSTNIKVSYFKGDELFTYVCTHSFAENHRPASGGKPGFNITIDGNKLHYGSSKSLNTTHTEFQESDVNLAAIHYALLNCGLGNPSEIGEIDLVVTLPIGQYFNCQAGGDLTKNVKNIEGKKKSILRPVIINNGIEQVKDTNSYEAVTPFKIANVQVMPEGVSAIMSTLADESVDDYSETLLVDLGGFTLDLCLITGEFSDLVPCGYDTINVAQVINAVRSVWGENQPQARVSHLIAHRDNEDLWESTFKNVEKRNEVRSALSGAVEQLSEMVVSVCKKLCASPNRVYLVGGGASLVIDAITEAYEKDSDVVMLSNPQTALAREIAIYHYDD